MKYTPGIWHNKTHKITFALCVDDFGVKYFWKDYARHLINAMKDHYKVTIDWEGKIYCGLNIDWNFNKGLVYVSIRNYVRHVLLKFELKPPGKHQHAPHQWTAPVYGQNTAQHPTDISQTSLLDKNVKYQIQPISDTSLYYSEIYPCIKPTLNEIAYEQSSPT